MTPLLILIPACNEATGIGEMVSSIRLLLTDADLLVVIDDGSNDETAQRACEAGARVFRRCSTQSEQRKGAALHWGLAQLPVRQGEVVVVLDADARVDDGFFDALRVRFDQGATAIQGFIKPVASAASSVGSLAACSTLMEQQVDDRLRNKLGWPVRLRGTGMAFRRDILDTVLSRLVTTVEDVELSLLIAQQGVQVQFAPEAVVFDPLPATSDAASRQRARWLTGQADVLTRYWPIILKLLLRGPAYWSLIGSMLLKPRVVWVALRMLALLALMWLPFTQPLAALLGLSLIIDGIYLAMAVALFGSPRERLRALAGLPAYGLMWLRSVLLAVRGTPGWLRARP